MPKEGISIYFTIKDGASQVLSAIGDKTKALDKETQQLAQSTSALEKSNKSLLTQQSKLKNELDAANKKVKEAQKAYSEYGDELSKATLDGAIQKQADLKQELIEVDTQIKANKKTYGEYVETLRKSEGGSSSGSSGGLSSSSLAMGLISGTAGNMLSESLGNIAESFLTSAIGVPLASIATNGISDMVSGALAGSVFGPLGALIGGAIGLFTGAMSGVLEVFEEKDDAFKEYYVGLYEDVNEATESRITSGSTTAGSREQTQKAFAKRFGSADAADDYLDQVQTMAARTNYGYDEIVTYAQSLLNTYDPNRVFSVLQSLSDATAGLNLSSSDVSTMISGLSRMRTTGKTTQEYLNYFSERGVDVYTALGEALGVDKSEIAGMVTAGDIEGEFAADAILDYIDREFGGLSEDLMSTYDAMVDNLDDIMTTLDAAAGEGYNETRKSGLEAETEAYSGALGEAMEEINRISGENKAYLENLSEQYTREALSAVLLGEETSLFSAEDQQKLDAIRAEYEEAAAAYATGDQEAGLRMEALKEDAEALATAAYESSSQYQALIDSQLDQVEAIRENTAGLAAATNAYRLSQEQSKGQAATYISPFLAALGGRTVEQVKQSAALYEQASETGDWDTYADYVLRQAGGFRWSELFSGHAFGLDRVPYDDYPALLHEGERVLTASEARAEDSGANQQIIQISVTGNSFVGTGEEMADQIAELLADRLEGAAVIAVPR